MRYVSIAHGSRKVLNNISLSIFQGEFIGVFGSNGAGKTTLMRTLIGLLPYTGEILILGKNIKHSNHFVGYMPQIQSSLLDKRISGRDLVAIAIDGHRWGISLFNKYKQNQVHNALVHVGASHIADRPIGNLSGGERQQLLLAQFLVHKSRLLLLDEPLISLDPKKQQNLIKLIRNITRTLNITVLFSAHELNPLINVIDRVLYLGNGSVALGTTKEIITSSILSKLYDTSVKVIHNQGFTFIMSEGQLLDRDPHSCVEKIRK